MAAPQSSHGCCEAASQPEPRARTDSSGSKVLLAYFSRAGENYYYGGRTQLAVGNTEVLAGMIAELIGVRRLSHRARRSLSRRLRGDRRAERPGTGGQRPPGHREPADSIGATTPCCWAVPIWNVRAPMIMSTFVESFDFTGKTDLPVHDVRGERTGNDGARLRGVVPWRDHRRRPRGARRGSRECRCRR